MTDANVPIEEPKPDVTKKEGRDKQEVPPVDARFRKRRADVERRADNIADRLPNDPAVTAVEKAELHELRGELDDLSVATEATLAEGAPTQAAHLDNPGIGGHEDEQTFPSNEALYAHLLGTTELPKTPEAMPDTFFLPPEVTNEFAKALALTLEDDRERGAHSTLANGTLQFTEIGEGDKEKISIDTDLSPEEILLGKGNNDLLHYHTHPSRRFLDHFGVAEDQTKFAMTGRKIVLPLDDGMYEDFTHSIGDISGIVALTNRALMDAVVHSGGISLIVKTDKVKQPRNIVLGKLKAIHDLKKIEKQGRDENSSFDRNTMFFLRTIQYLEEKGFAYYFWKPNDLVHERSDDMSTFHTFAQPYDITRRPVRVNEVTPENLSEGIRMRRLSLTPGLKAELGL